MPTDWWTKATRLRLRTGRFGQKTHLFVCWLHLPVVLLLLYYKFGAHIFIYAPAAEWRRWSIYDPRSTIHDLDS